jgi:hypothetical protein
VGFLLLYSEDLKDYDREIALVVEPSSRMPGSLERISLFKNAFKHDWDSKASFF